MLAWFKRSGCARIAAAVLAALAVFALVAPAFAQGDGGQGDGGQGELMQGAENMLRFVTKLVAIALLVAGIMSILRHHVVSAVIIILAGALLLGVGSDVSKLQRFGQAVFDLIFGG